MLTFSGDSMEVFRFSPDGNRFRLEIQLELVWSVAMELNNGKDQNKKAEVT